MPIVTVTDLVVSTRKVKLPARCPGCGGRLKQDRALRVWGFVDESRAGRLPQSSDDRLDTVAGLVLGDVGSDSGETFLDNVSIRCCRCDQVLTAGTFTVRPGR
jgi:hypothetical protein